MKCQHCDGAGQTPSLTQPDIVMLTCCVCEGSGVQPALLAEWFTAAESSKLGRCAGIEAWCEREMTLQWDREGDERVVVFLSESRPCSVDMPYRSGFKEVELKTPDELRRLLDTIATEAK